MATRRGADTSKVTRLGLGPIVEGSRKREQSKHASLPQGFSTHQASAASPPNALTSKWSKWASPLSPRKGRNGEDPSDPSTPPSGTKRKRLSLPVTVKDKAGLATSEEILSQLEKRSGISKVDQFKFKHNYPSLKHPRTPADFGEDAKKMPDGFKALTFSDQVKSLIFRKMSRGVALVRQTVPLNNEKAKHIHIFMGVLAPLALLAESFGQRGILVATNDALLVRDEGGEEEFSAGGRFDHLSAEGRQQVEQAGGSEEGVPQTGSEAEAERARSGESASSTGSAGTRGVNEPIVCTLDNFLVCFEKWLAGNHCGGPVEFIIIDEETHKLLGIIEVKQSLEVAGPQALFQLYSQMAAALEANGKFGNLGKQTVWGALTDGDVWVFASLTAEVVKVKGQLKGGGLGDFWILKGGEFVRSWPLSLLHLGRPTEFTSACLDRLCTCIIPAAAKKSVTEIQEAFQKAEAFLETEAEDMGQAFDKHLGLHVSNPGADLSKQRVVVELERGFGVHKLQGMNVPIIFDRGSMSSLYKRCAAAFELEGQKFILLHQQADPEEVPTLVALDETVADLPAHAKLELRFVA